MDLQTAFYIIGIIFMGVMLLLVVGILVVVLVIKTKINHVHRVINEKIGAVRDVTDKATTIFRIFHNLLKHS
jgi:hypothetical protein